MKAFVGLSVSVLFVVILASAAFAGGPGDTTVTFRIHNQSGATLIATGGYCNLTYNYGGGSSKRVNFSGEIPPGSTKTHNFTHIGNAEIQVCSLYATVKGGNRNYGIYFNTNDPERTSFTLNNSHIDLYNAGQNAIIHGLY